MQSVFDLDAQFGGEILGFGKLFFADDAVFQQLLNPIAGHGVLDDEEGVAPALVARLRPICRADSPLFLARADSLRRA
ncbi:MAG: hypothetical protein ACT4QC_19045 [Planctomycetaceae bacterium]